MPEVDSHQSSAGVPQRAQRVFRAIGAFAWVVLAAHALMAVTLWWTAWAAAAKVGRSIDIVGLSVGMLVLFEGVVLAVLCRALHWIGRLVVGLGGGEHERGAP